MRPLRRKRLLRSTERADRLVWSGRSRGHILSQPTGASLRPPLSAPRLPSEAAVPEHRSSFAPIYDLLERARARQIDEPVAPYEPADAMLERIDFALSEDGAGESDVIALLDQVAAATPRTSSRRFLNQLFAGKDDSALAAELLTVILNTSMYTFKAAGANAIIERVMTQHMAKLIGFDEGEGVFAPGGSMSNFTAIVIARNEASESMREDGHDGVPMVVYTSDISHYSITKGAAMAGIGRSNVRRIPCDDRGRMIPALLREAIERDLEAGRRPFMINATAGTTVLGSFDPIRDIAAIASEFGIWLHVDGALGGTMILSETHRHLVDGIDLADSVTWDAHKLMTVPLVCSVILVRKPGTLVKHFNEDASYLFQSDDDDLNFGTRALQCGRRNDALKVWALWKRHGDRGLGARVDHLMAMARHAASVIDRDPEMTLTKTPESVNVCFEVNGVSSPDLCEELRRQSRLVVGYGDVEGRDVIRIPFANPDMTFDQVEDALAEVRSVGLALRSRASASPRALSEQCC